MRRRDRETAKLVDGFVSKTEDTLPAKRTTESFNSNRKSWGQSACGQEVAMTCQLCCSNPDLFREGRGRGKACSSALVAHEQQKRMKELRKI